MIIKSRQVYLRVLILFQALTTTSKCPNDLKKVLLPGKEQ
jgi:hypothetical protein